MKCEDINKLLAAYLDGEVSPEERRKIESHLALCEKCKEELRLLAATREELRQALKAATAGVEPSPRAWDAVSQRISSETSLWERFSGVFNRPLWRVAVPVAILLILTAGVLWRTNILPGNRAPSPAAETAMAPQRATPPAPTPTPTVPAAPESKALEPPVMFDAPLVPVPAPAAPIPGVQPPAITVQAPPPAQVTVPLPSPEGWMEKTISLNQSRTVNGITFILQRIELTAKGVKVYAFVTPPGYNLPQGPAQPPSQFMVPAEAEYFISGGVVKKASASAIGFLENGILYLWENLDPVPGSARELTFRITKLGDLTGPWEFRVALQ